MVPFFSWDVGFWSASPDAIALYIRRTKTKSLSDGDGNTYYTYRIVEPGCIGFQVKQRTLFSLGTDFSFAQAQRPCTRIEQLQQGREPHQST